MKERCTMTLAAACTAAIVFAGAALAGGPDRNVRADLTVVGPAPAPVQAQKKDGSAPVQRSDSLRWSGSADGGHGGVAGGSNCCEAHGGPGCDDQTCQDEVCNLFNPSCCDAWTEACVTIAESVCEVCTSSCGAPGAGDCCSPNVTPGCDNAECCEAVCAQNSFCCDNFWDSVCSDAAKEICVGLCVDPACVGATGSCCLSNGTPGCDSPSCCTDVCAEDPFCCDVVFDGFCAAIAGIVCFDHCAPEGCGDEIAISCCAANIAELRHPFCNDSDCCEAVCAQDPFCCNTEWDIFCATDANTICGCPAMYSNITSFQGFYFPHGSDESYDLIRTVEPGLVTQITKMFVVTAGDLTAIDMDLIFVPLEFDEDDVFIEPNSSHPNAVVVNFTADDLNLTGVLNLTLTDEEGFFNTNDLGSTIPVVMWAGVRFNTVVGPGDYGSALFNPPSVGFSADNFFLQGFGLAFFGGPPGGPVANFGWALLGEGDVVPPCGNPNAGDCFTPTPGIAGCSDEACCELVCACDPFCCDSFWDINCVGPNDFEPGCSAIDLCSEPPTEGACTTTTPHSCASADLTDSQAVGVPDLLALLGCWGTPTPGGCGHADLTGSNSVGVPDLLQLLGCWGAVPPPTVSCVDDVTESQCAGANDQWAGGQNCP